MGLRGTEKKQGKRKKSYGEWARSPNRNRDPSWKKPAREKGDPDLDSRTLVLFFHRAAINGVEEDRDWKLYKSEQPGGWHHHF